MAMNNDSGATSTTEGRCTAVYWPSIFWRLFTRHRSKHDRPFYFLVVTVHQAWALYVALSSLNLPLRQRIRPFTTNKAISAPPLHRDGALFPVLPPVEGFGGGLCRLFLNGVLY